MTTPEDILSSQTTAIVVLTAQLSLNYLNQAAEALLEISIARAQGLDYSACLYESSLTDAALHSVLDQNQPFTKRRAIIELPSGTSFNGDYTVTPMIVNTAASRLLIEIQPLDRLLRIDRDDQQAAVQETSRKLIRGLAHEVKNPLGGIRGAAQLLERELSSTSQRDYTQIIIEEVDRLRVLVDRMLGPNQLPHFEPINIHRVLEHVIQLLDADQRGHIHFERDYDPSLPLIEADMDQMIQALLNIGRNAQQALQGCEAPQITFTSRIIRQFTIGPTRHRLVARIDVCDNGRGIPPDLLQQLYYPMISGRADGTGLGLSITQNILSQHHGLIETSSKPGATTFSIYLPLEQPHAHV